MSITIFPIPTFGSTLARKKDVGFVSISPLQKTAKLSLIDGIRVVKKYIGPGHFAFINCSNDKYTAISKVEPLVFNDGKSVFLDLADRNSKDPIWFRLDQIRNGFFIVYPRHDVFAGELELVVPSESFPAELLEQYNSLPFSSLTRITG